MSRQCEKGFIQTHVDYTINQQSPQCFHIWTAIAVISAVLGRRVYIDRSYYTLFPNLFVVLVSPSGVGCKGTALTQGIELIDLAQIPISILRGKITPTRLISRLQASAMQSPEGFAELMIFSREFKVFTKGVIKDSSLIEDLTDLYDNNAFDYETEHSLQQSIKKPCVTILGASTPEWLSGGSAGDIMSGGFGARVLPVTVLKDEKEIAWPEKTKLELACQAKLVKDLMEIGELKGEYHVLPDAKKFFEEWYVNRKKNRKFLDTRLDGYYSKKHDQILKLSIILAASMSSEMVIRIPHIQTAMSLLEENEKNLLYAYSGAAENKEVKYRDQVIARIKDKGEIPHSDLAQYFYHGLGRKGLREVIYGLIEEKMIEAVTKQTKTKPILMYKWIGEE